MLAQNKELDAAIFYPGLVRCRINCFDTLNGGAITIRLISLTVPSIDELRLPQILKKIVSQPKGLILVTGATGTGKTTTVAAMIRYLNDNFNKHIITIEEPIAFVHSSHKCLITQREVGLHTHNFNQALRGALREDPDVIVIEELRDKITVETVLQAAQTGHLVLSTLHTRGALDVISRLVNLYNPEQQYPVKIQLVESLIAVISQSLVKTVNNKLIPVNDILINTPTMQDYLLNNRKEEALQLMENNLNGMQIMNEAIYVELLKGTIGLTEALKVSPDPTELERRIRTGGVEGHSSAREWMEINE
jgi:twitching motility protein PilT